MEPSNPVPEMYPLKDCNPYLKAAFTPNPVLRRNSSGLCGGGTSLNYFVITQQSAQLYITEHKVLKSAKMWSAAAVWWGRRQSKSRCFSRHRKSVGFRLFWKPVVAKAAAAKKTKQKKHWWLTKNERDTLCFRSRAGFGVNAAWNTFFTLCLNFETLDFIKG